jgi:hypothetical protein
VGDDCNRRAAQPLNPADTINPEGHPRFACLNQGPLCHCLLRARRLVSLHRASLYYQGDGQSDTEDVYDDADNQQLQRERIFDGARKGHHDAIHEEVNGHAIENTGDYGVRQKEWYPAARRNVDGGGRKCDKKMTEKAEQRGWKPALEGARAQHAGGDPLQQPYRRASEIPVDDERGANVQRAARESGPQDCEQRVGIL